MLKQIVFIYRDEFVCKLVGKMAASADIKCYTLSSIDENFAYILNDLSPELVIVDEVALEKNSTLIDASLKDAQSTFKTVLLKKRDSEGHEFDFQMDLPIKVETFIKEINSLVN